MSSPSQDRGSSTQDRGSSTRFPPTKGQTTITMSSSGSGIGSKSSSWKPGSSTVSSRAESSSGGPLSPSSVPAKTSGAAAVAKASPGGGAKGAFSRAKTIVGLDVTSAESSRMRQNADRIAYWKRWGPYLSERQWSTVREDYSANGSW